MDTQEYINETVNERLDKLETLSWGAWIKF